MIKDDKEIQSAAFDVETVHLGNHADAWPAVSFHPVIVLQAVEIGDRV